MAVLKTALDPSAEDFRRNAEAMRAAVADLGAKVAAIKEGGGEEARKKHLARGKLLPRERVRALLDPARRSSSCRQLAAYGMYGGEVPAAGIITGIGRVSGRECVIVANDATVKGGTYFPITVKKHLRAQEIARENHLPCIYLVDSGGAYLPTQDEVFPDRDHFGRIFYNQATMSAAGIPQIAVVMGSCTAGGAYVPAMSDESIIVRNQGTIFLGGPPLVKAATGEVVSAEELGGARRARAHLRCRRPLRARTTPMRLDRAAASWPTSTARSASSSRSASRPSRSTTRTSSTAWCRRRAQALRRARGHRAPRRTARVLDEFKPLYGRRWSPASRASVAIPSASSPTTASCSPNRRSRRAHFIELCAQRGIPLVFLQNITGFMVGRKYEAGGIAKDGAKMVTAVASARGAEVHRHHRRQLRRRQLRHVRARLRAALPVDVAERAHLGDGRRAGGERARDRAPRQHRGARRELDRGGGGGLQGADPRAIRGAQGHPYYATARLWDDGVIDPADTRRVLGLALAAA